MSRPWIDVRVSLASLTPGSAGRRVRMMLLVALATPLVGSCGEGSVQIVDPARGFEVEYPEGWFLASESVTPYAGVGPDLFAVGTFVLRPDESRCAHMPVGALDDLGPTDAFVAVEERIGPNSSDLSEPRPATFQTLDGVDTGTGLFECTDVSEREGFGVLRMVSFAESGRSFIVIIAIGREASDDRVAEAGAVLDSFTVLNQEG